MKYFFLFFPGNRIYNGDNLHEISDPVFLEKKK